MIQAQRYEAECHPELWKLRSSGLSKPKPGEMPAPWSVQLVLCQRGISRGQGGLKFLWILSKLSWETINCSKTSNPDDLIACLYLFQLLGWVAGTLGAFSLQAVRCVCSLHAHLLGCWWRFSGPTGTHGVGRENASTGCWCKQPTICSCGGSSTTNTLH